MSRQYTDSSDELCPLGGKRKFCTSLTVPISYHKFDNGLFEAQGIVPTFYGCGNYSGQEKYHWDIQRSLTSNILSSEWVLSGDTVSATKKYTFEFYTFDEFSVTCSGSIISSCGASGTDVWYKK